MARFPLNIGAALLCRAPLSPCQAQVQEATEDDGRAVTNDPVATEDR